MLSGYNQHFHCSPLAAVLVPANRCLEKAAPFPEAEGPTTNAFATQAVLNATPMTDFMVIVTNISAQHSAQKPSLQLLVRWLRSCIFLVSPAPSIVCRFPCWRGVRSECCSENVPRV